MLFEKTCCKKETEQSKNVKHRVAGDACNRVATESRDRNKNVRDYDRVKYVENDVARNNADAKSRVNACSTTTSSSSSSLRPQPCRKSTTSSVTRAGGSERRETPDRIAVSRKCYEEKKPFPRPPCNKVFEWQRGKHVKDDCGSGILPTRTNFGKYHRSKWCKTPLSIYQSTIGEVGRQILCNEFRLKRDVNPPPPCNVCEYALPPCRGYYRKYDCLRECENEYAKTDRDGRKTYRNRVERYWQPCQTDSDNEKTVRHYAPHNAYLGNKIRRTLQTDSSTCW